MTQQQPSKVHATETIATHVRVFARKAGRELTKTLVEEIVSEYRGGHRGEFLQRCARVANVDTVLRRARRDERALYC